MSGRPRPRFVLAVAGTGTEVGKTWVAARLAAALRARGWLVAARKPAQSFAPEEAGATDAELLGAATGEAPEQVCPRARWYERPLAPPLAADSLGRPAFGIADLAREIGASWPRPAADVGLVELAGGPRSPLAHDGDGIDLLRLVAPERVLLVADAGLGTLNAVGLALDALAPTPTRVHLNRWDAAQELHRRNLAWLVERAKLAPSVDVAALAGALEAELPAWCRHCGRASGACDGACARPLDPPRFCPRCGRKLAVQVAPTGHFARCRDHGPLRD
jgi:dethiobiotin synthetase